MALIYGMLRSWVMVLRKYSAWKQRRRKKAYEIAKQAFEAQEQECKGYEVVVGRPSDYHDQFKLMKLFYECENARQRWIKAAQQLVSRKRFEQKIRKLNGKKLPYTFGLVDMALCFKILDLSRELGLIDLARTWSLVKEWLV